MHEHAGSAPPGISGFGPARPPTSTFEEGARTTVLRSWERRWFDSETLRGARIARHRAAGFQGSRVTSETHGVQKSAACVGTRARCPGSGAKKYPKSLTILQF